MPVHLQGAVDSGHRPDRQGIINNRRAHVRLPVVGQKINKQVLSSKLVAVLHKGEKYSGEGDLEDAYAARYFCYWTDRSAPVGIIVYDPSQEARDDVQVIPRRIGIQVFVPSEGHVQGLRGAVRVRREASSRRLRMDYGEW